MASTSKNIEHLKRNDKMSSLKHLAGSGRDLFHIAITKTIKRQ
jgi:hypothetical protein